VGLGVGAVLQTDVEVEVLPDLPDLLEALDVSVDGAALPVESGRVLLRPTDLGDGPHLLVAEARYTDGDAARVEVGFRVGVPTWSADVSPFFVSRCDVCHGERGYARRLETAEAWRADLDLVLTVLEEQRMPLPPNLPLTPVELGMLQAWRAAGAP